MSLAGLNARHGSTLSVYRPTVGDDSVNWGSAVFAAVRLELLPMTDEVAREVFGSDARVECMVLTTLDVRKSDGIVVSAGTYAGSRFRVMEAKPFRRFTQLGLERTTEPIP